MDVPTSALLHGDDDELRREAARMMGKARTDRKIAATRATAESHRGTKWSEEQKAKLREAQIARRERERQERAAQAQPSPQAAPPAKRPPGRPKTKTEDDPPPKRPRGRPKKPAGEVLA